MKKKRSRLIKVGLLLIATGKYISFVDQFLKSAEKYFLNDPKFKKYIYVFTDSNITPKGTIKLYKEHKSFPHPTLTRFHSFYEYRNILSQMDYLYYSDVDMRFVDFIGDEILGRLVGVIHPGYYNKSLSKLPYESNSKSSAFVKNGSHYYCGGFNGGSARNFLKLAKELSNNIDIDLGKGIIAIHHDESHLNRYFTENIPDKILTPSYCYPEGQYLPFVKKIVALDKNHALVRYTGFWMIMNLIFEFVSVFLINKPVVLAKKILRK